MFRHLPRSSALAVVLVMFLSMPTEAAAQQIRPWPRSSDDVPRDLLPRVKRFERTDLWEGLGPQTLYGAYRKELAASDAKTAPTTNDLPDTSLQQFKWQLKRSASKAEFINAAKEYLQREGFTVEKNANP